MTNCEWYASIVGRYRRKLNEINEKYDQQAKSKEGYRGSPRYESDIAEIEQKRMGEINALRADCRDSFTNCIENMQKAADTRPMTAPTPEQLAILQALQMRERLTRDDLNHAANALTGCSVALGVLEELARKYEILGFHASTGVSNAFVQGAIKSLADSANVLLTLERTNQRRELMNPAPGTGEGPFGNHPSHANIKKFRIDVDPDSAQSCIDRFGGVSPDAYQAFCKATDS